MSDLHAEAMALVEREIAAVREAWDVLTEAEPEIRAAIMADVELELLDTKARMARLEILRKYLDHAAQKREEASPLSETAA